MVWLMITVGVAPSHVARVEEAAVEKTDAHGFEEVVAGDLPVVDVVAGAAGHGREIFDLRVVGVDRTLRRQAAHGGGGRDAGDRRDFFLNALPEAVVIRRLWDKWLAAD